MRDQLAVDQVETELSLLQKAQAKLDVRHSGRSYYSPPLSSKSEPTPTFVALSHEISVMMIRCFALPDTHSCSAWSVR